MNTYTSSLSITCLAGHGPGVLIQQGGILQFVFQPGSCGVTGMDQWLQHRNPAATFFIKKMRVSNEWFAVIGEPYTGSFNAVNRVG